MSVSKTNRANTSAPLNSPPPKDDRAFRKALKSVSEQKAEGQPDGKVRPEGERVPDLKAPEAIASSFVDEPTAKSEAAEVESPQEPDASFEVEETPVDEIDAEFEKDEAELPEAALAEMTAQGSPPQQQISESTVAPAAPPTQVMQQLVTAMAAEGWVGADIHGRKVVMLNVQCPGRGSVRIRLRKEDDGVSVRVRADNDELSSLLETHQDQLRDAMSKKGLTLANLEVVT